MIVDGNSRSSAQSAAELATDLEDLVERLEADLKERGKFRASLGKELRALRLRAERMFGAFSSAAVAVLPTVY